MFKQSLLVAQNISYSFDDNHLFSNLTISLGKQKTGLVGRNGIGKSTLIKILVGLVKPTEGAINHHGSIGYLPQDFSYHALQSIAAILEIDKKIEALERITSGIGTEHDTQVLGTDWDIIERTTALFDQLGLGHLELTRTIGSLSGGETTRVFLARLLLQNPDFLILDEPTNNLDQESREALYATIANFKGGILVVSHDRKLLSFMDAILELTSLGLTTYGGNYAAYVKQKQLEQEAHERQIVDAEKTLKKTKKIAQLTKERHEQRAAKGNKLRHTGAEDTILLNIMKSTSEKTKSRIERQTDKQIDSAREKLSTAKAQLEQNELLHFELEATRVHNTKKVLEITDLAFAYPDCAPIIQNFNLVLMGPKRIAITGLNGSGKTTLLKSIMHQLTPTSGSIFVGVEHYAYLDQRLSILDHHASILENFKRLNPSVKETDCRLRLAAFLFSNEAALQTVGTLSGGEKMRAALACILMGQTPSQLILLDEPTNNMDLESIASMENALQDYQGALIVVSHDEMFLENIGIKEKINL